MKKTRPSDLYYKHLTKNNNSWCPVPWTQIAVHNSGEYRSCIQARTCKKTKGILKDENNKIMRADTHSIEDVRNAPLLKEVRKDMLDSKRHSMCIRCNEEDDAKMNSRRRYAIREYYNKYEYDFWNAESSTKPDGTLVIEKSPIIEWDIRLGNLCNLKCRMCDPSESTQWYDEWFDTMFKGFKTDFTEVELVKDKNRAKVKNDIYSWYDEVNFYDQFDTNASGTRKIHFSGGEPTLVENMYDMLQKLIDSGIAKEMDLDYNINLTNIPKRAINLWHEFKSVQIGGSVDGVGKINEYIRYPSKWSKVEENIKWLDANTQPNISLFNTFTWQILNAVEVFDLVKYQIENDFVKFNAEVNSVFFSMHFLHSPDYLNVKALPKELKEYVQQEFDKFDNEFFKLWETDDISLKERFRDKMQSMLDFMWSEDKSDHFIEFVKRTKIQDKYRNQNFAELYPVISNYIKRNYNEF
tara:strand:+ start:15479 stop:16879 length:1401 start_codon:yes stop_codon:yes gene_type:complete